MFPCQRWWCIQQESQKNDFFEEHLLGRGQSIAAEPKPNDLFRLDELLGGLELEAWKGLPRECRQYMCGLTLPGRKRFVAKDSGVLLTPGLAWYHIW